MRKPLGIQKCDRPTDQHGKVESQVSATKNANDDCSFFCDDQPVKLEIKDIHFDRRKEDVKDDIHGLTATIINESQ